MYFFLLVDVRRTLYYAVCDSVCSIVLGCKNKLSVKGNVAVYKDLNLEFVTKNSFCHEFAARKCFELSREQRARSLVNCILSRLYLLGELSEDG